MCSDGVDGVDDCVGHPDAGPAGPVIAAPNDACVGELVQDL